MNHSRNCKKFEYKAKQSATVLVLEVTPCARGWTKQYGFVYIKMNIIERERRWLTPFMWVYATLTINPDTMLPVVSAIESCADEYCSWTASEETKEGHKDIVLNGGWSLTLGPIQHGPVRFYQCRTLGHILVTDELWEADEFKDADALKVKLILMRNPVTVGKHASCYWFLREAEVADDDEEPVVETWYEPRSSIPTCQGKIMPPLFASGFITEMRQDIRDRGDIWTPNKTYKLGVFNTDRTMGNLLKPFQWVQFQIPTQGRIVLGKAPWVLENVPYVPCWDRRANGRVVLALRGKIPMRDSNGKERKFLEEGPRARYWHDTSLGFIKVSVNCLGCPKSAEGLFHLLERQEIVGREAKTCSWELVDWRPIRKE